MKVYNHIFTDYKALDLFLSKNTLSSDATILIQCFDGNLNQSTTQTLLAYLSELFPHAKIIGSSTDGEIIDGISQSNSIVLSFSLFESTQIESSLVSLENGSFVAGEELGNQALKFGAKAMILFSDALKTNGDFLMEGINSIQSDIIVAGGMAGDNGEFKQTYVICNRQVYYNSAVAVFLKGESLKIYNISSFNWTPIGPSFTVTKSKQNKVYTLDHTPITQVYREYLGDEVADILPAVGIVFPIIMDIDAQQIGRAPLFLCEEGGLGFGGNIPEGTVVRFAIGSINLIIESSDATSQNVLKAQPEAIYIYSCMARRRFMGHAVNHEIAPLNEIAPVSGFFTYGEFFTQNSTKNCVLLNETMTILALSESNTNNSNTQISKLNIKVNDWSNITFTALSHLINKTSTELFALNQSLQQRVEEEIKLNREKDKIMLVQSKRATMGEMISMIAHQWRQPITTIGLVSDNLALDSMLNEISPENVLESAKSIDRQVRYLSKTIDDFSSYFRPENKLDTFSVNELYTQLIEIIGVSLKECGISVIQDFSKEAELYTYKNEIIQICLNLFTNAKDAITQNNIQNGYIEFKYSFIAQAHCIQISDNGGGVAQNISEKIFEPYFSTKKVQHGAGLGLYMSKTIAQQHLEGDLTHYNDQKGAVFVLVFK